MPCRRTAKLLWLGPPSGALLTQQCPSETRNWLESQPPSVPGVPRPDTLAGLWFTSSTCFTCAQVLKCSVAASICPTITCPTITGLPHEHLALQKRWESPKSRRIPPGSLLDIRDKHQIQPVQGLMICVFLMQYQMKSRKPHSCLLGFFIHCKETKVTGPLFFCGLPLKRGCPWCPARPCVEGPVWSESVGD